MFPGLAIARLSVSQFTQSSPVLSAGAFVFTRKGEIVRCPWHGWEFDIRTGKFYCDPEKIKTRTYPVETASGARILEGPYVAETVPLSVEEDYIVVEM